MHRSEPAQMDQMGAPLRVASVRLDRQGCDRDLYWPVSMGTPSSPASVCPPCNRCDNGPASPADRGDEQVPLPCNVRNRVRLAGDLRLLHNPAKLVKHARRSRGQRHFYLKEVLMSEVSVIWLAPAKLVPKSTGRQHRIVLCSASGSGVHRCGRSLAGSRGVGWQLKLLEHRRLEP